MYEGIIESFLYMTYNKPSILFIMEKYRKFQAYPKESHLKATKRILKCLKEICDLVLFYPSRDSFKLIENYNKDYAGYLFYRKSIDVMINFLGSSLIYWSSKKKHSALYG